MDAPPADRSRADALWSPIMLALMAGTLALAIYRAITWSITADEALTYNVYLSDGWLQLLRYGPNNHVLFTWLAKAAISIFGARPWSLRLPTMLAAAGYLAVAAWIACRFFTGPWRVLAAGLLCLNPLVMDYLVAARGYGLALALLLAAVALVLRGHEVDASGRRAVWRRIGISVCCALAVAANLAFAPPAAALIGVSLWRLRGRHPISLLLPGAMLMVMALGPYLMQLRHSAMQVGFNSITSTCVDLWNDSIRHDETAESSLQQVKAESVRPAEPGKLAGAAAISMGALLVGLCVLAAPRPRGKQRLPVNAAAAALLLTVLLLVLLHGVARIPYPAARTGVYLIPLGTLVPLLFVNAAAPLLRRCVATGGWVLLIFYAGQTLSSRCLAYARYDAGSRRLFVAIQEDATKRVDRPVRVGGTWIYEPAMNFYRAMYHADWMQPMVRNYGHPRPGDYDYFLINPIDDPSLKMENCRVIAVDLFSGTQVLACAPR